MLPLKQFLHPISWWHGYQIVIMVIMVFFRHTNIEFEHGITQYYNDTICESSTQKMQWYC